VRPVPLTPLPSRTANLLLGQLPRASCVAPPAISRWIANPANRGPHALDMNTLIRHRASSSNTWVVAFAFDPAAGDVARCTFSTPARY
jgi:hypothetical protein